jgi:sulfopyruvate decarboxylase subunit beta
LADRLKDEIIVTSAGNSSELWWDITGETERVFYLEASMSLASVFAAGIALGTKRTVVAFNGDGAFCMNPGHADRRAPAGAAQSQALRDRKRRLWLDQRPNHPFAELMDYAAVAKAAGVERVYEFSTLEGLGQGLDDMIKVPGHAFAVLHVDPLGRHLPSPPLDGPEVKFRFGRYLERTGGAPIFDAPLRPK